MVKRLRYSLKRTRHGHGYYAESFGSNLLTSPWNLSSTVAIWFNESRPHYALGLRSPMQFLAEVHQCNMYWRDTAPTGVARFAVCYPSESIEAYGYP